MFIEADYDEVKKNLNILKTLFDMKVRPADYPEVPNSPYRPGYDWLFTIEREIFRILEPRLKPYRLELIGTKGVLSELIANAFFHGNARRMDKSIHISGFLGSRGILVSVSDQGQGFDFQKVLQLKTKGKIYYFVAGNGIDRMAQSQNFSVFYDQNGTRGHVLHFFEEEIKEEKENNKSLIVDIKGYFD